MSERKAPRIRNYCRYNNTGTDNELLYNEKFPGVLELYKLEGIFLSWQPSRYVHEIREEKTGREKGEKKERHCGGIRDRK